MPLGTLSVTVCEDGVGLGKKQRSILWFDALDNCWDNGRGGHLSVISGLSGD